MLHAQDRTDLKDIAEKVRAGERLSFEDGVRLYESPDIHTLGELANLVRQRRHGRNTYYNINRHINYTNYCVLRCKFCSFYRPYPKGGSTNTALPEGRRSGDGGYELTLDQIVAEARRAADAGATEVHIVGGLHPKLPFSYYLDMCRQIRQACPRLHIKAFTAIEIIHFTRISQPRLTIREVLARLREAGLGSLPGGGAEIFDERVHREVFENKVGQEGWFDVHAAAHEMGMFTNATMLYGHIEKPHQIIEHLDRLRALQDETGGFVAFIPLMFHVEHTQLTHLRPATGRRDLEVMAVSRIYLDNFPHLKAFWIMLGVKLAQVSLSFGADDMDGTVVMERITHAAGAKTPQALGVAELRALIEETGRVPIERTTLYELVEHKGNRSNGSR